MKPNKFLSQIIPIIVIYLATGLFLQADVTFTRVPGGDLATNPGFFYNLGIGDYDNDGYVDLISANTLDAPCMLFHNNGDGTFTRVKDPAIESDNPSSGASPLWGDYDNDGDLDLFVSNYEATLDAWDPSTLVTKWPTIYAGRDDMVHDDFYRNEGDGTFTKITEGAWVNDNGDPFGAGSAWVDYDRDGWLDLYVGNAYNDANFLYHNNGDGTMSNVGGAICAPQWESHGLTWSDYNNDGWPDLIIAGQANMLYQNNGDGTFTPGRPDRAWRDPIREWGVTAADLDNDGDMDFAIASQDENGIYLNDGTGRFELIDDGVINVNDNVMSAGVYSGDYDNDGFIDLYFANPLQNPKNFLYHNEGDGTFSPVTDVPMVQENGYGWGASFVDVDNDGDLDIIENDGTIWPNTIGPYPIKLYLNQGNTNNWILLKLEGTASNRQAIGAKVRITSTINNQTVHQLREVRAGGGTGSQDDSRVHFGLGDAAIIETLQVEWPSGYEQELHNLAANQILSIVEAEPWAGYPHSTREGDVDTGAWIGWINVTASPWIWCYGAGGWMYCPEENVSEAGAWVYFFK